MNMKKLLAVALVTVMSATALVSCGSKNISDYDPDKYVTLGTYKGVAVSQEEIDKQLESQVKAALEANKYDESTGKAAEDGNTIKYSYTGTIAGEANDKLTATEKVFVQGTGSTGITELNEALKGASKGDSMDVTVTVPDAFTGDENVDGREALLSVTVVDVTTSVTPETLTDDMVKKYTEEAYTTVDAYMEFCTESITESLAWNTVVANCTFDGYPEAVAEAYYEGYIVTYQNQAAQYGMTIDSLVGLYGMDAQTFYKQMAQQSVAQVKADLAMYAIAKAESLEADEATKSEMVKTLMESYGFKTEEEAREGIGEEAIEMSALYEIVVAFVTDNATVDK